MLLSLECLVYDLTMKIEGLTRGQLNFCDLGGIPVKGNRIVRPGMFYRSAGLYWMRHVEREVFQDLGIREVLDLRSKEECVRCPDPVFDGVEMLQHSGLVSKGGEDIDFSIQGMNQIGGDAIVQYEKLKQYYMEMPFGNDAFKVMFDTILQGRVPFLFHCATGKDRTGAAAMVLLLALGAQREDILKDYMLSKEERAERLAYIYQKYADRMEGHPELKRLLTMKEGVLEEIGRAMLDAIETRYTSPETFLLQEYGLDETAIQKIRMIGTCEK